MKTKRLLVYALFVLLPALFTACEKEPVTGTIRAHEVKVCLNQGCDDVFAPDYNLMPIEELGNFVSTNRHLPEVAPAAQMEADGIDLSEMNALLLKKVEELTLYIVDLNKRIETYEIIY